MRRIVLALTTVLMGVAWTAVPAAGQQPLRIAFVDSQAILSQAPGAAEAQQEFERQMDRFSEEIETMGRAIDQLVQEYQAQQATLLPNVRQAREDEIRQRDARYEQRLAEMEQEAAMTRQRLIEPILMQISDAIEALRVADGYAIIFDLTGQSIVAADPALDLTDRVVARLRQSAGVTNP